MTARLFTFLFVVYLFVLTLGVVGIAIDKAVVLSWIYLGISLPGLILLIRTRGRYVKQRQTAHSQEEIR